MTTEVVTKNYERLDFYVDLIVQKLDDAVSSVKQYMDSYFKVAKEEGISEDEAKKYLKTKLPHSTYYKYLPIDISKREYNKSTPVDNSLTEESSSSESATGSQGEEIEQEVAITPPPEPPVREQELQEELSEKDKALEELRKEVRTLREMVPDEHGNPDQLKRIQESLEQTLEENRELKEVVEKTQWQQKEPIPFILPKRIVPELIRDLNHSLNNDVQMFLCEDNKGRFLDWITGYQTYTSEVKRELAQRREQLQNATKTRPE